VDKDEAMTRARRWTACLLLCLGLGDAAAEATTAKEINDASARALWWADFDELTRQHALHGQPGRRTATGDPELSIYRRGLARVLKGKRKASEAFFVEMESLTRQWAIEHPRSPLAHALHAEAILTRAWFHRGGGYSNTVSPLAWEEFQKHVRRAAEYLGVSADVVFSDSSGHLVALNVGRASGWGEAQLRAVAEAGLKKRPDDDDLYAAVLTGLLPKWGGSARTVDQYIEHVVAQTKAERGMAMYARLYELASQEQFKQALFEESGVRWPQMKQGFEDLLARYPDPANLNRYAYFACMAQDRPKATDLLAEIGDKVDADRWGETGLRSYEGCKRWIEQL
jgi:hypothetical protein